MSIQAPVSAVAGEKLNMLMEYAERLSLNVATLPDARKWGEVEDPFPSYPGHIWAEMVDASAVRITLPGLIPQP
jgi:hypothetical protein